MSNTWLLNVILKCPYEKKPYQTVLQVFITWGTSAQLLFLRKSCNASPLHFPFSHCSFLLYSILRALIVGFLQITSDYLLKPILAVIFNGLLQPQFIFTQNIFQSICNTLEPLTKLMAISMKPLTDCVRAFRIVEVKNLNKDSAMGRYQTFQGQNNAWRIITPIKFYLQIKLDCVVKEDGWDGRICRLECSGHLDTKLFDSNICVFDNFMQNEISQLFWLKNVEIHLESKTEKGTRCRQFVFVWSLAVAMEIDMNCKIQSSKHVFSGFAWASNVICNEMEFAVISAQKASWLGAVCCQFWPRNQFLNPDNPKLKFFFIKAS